MRQLLCLLIILLPVMAQAQVSISAYAAPLNDDGIEGETFDVVVDLTNVGIGSNDSIIDMDNDGVIDARRLVNTTHADFDGYYVKYFDTGDSLGLAASGAGMPAADFNDSLESQIEFSPKTHAKLDTSTAVRGAINDSLQANWAAFISDDTVTSYRAAIHDSLDANWATFTASSAIKWWDSLYVYGDTTKILYDLIDTTTAKIPTATLADSTDGGAIRATTAGTADALALIGWGIAVDNDSVVVSATDLDERYFTEAEVQGEIGDSLAEYLERVQFKDSLDAANYLDSTNIASQGIIPDDIDTLDNDFVFEDIFRGTSAQAESVLVTIETIEDSLARYLERVEFNDSLDAVTYLDSTNITNQGLIPEDLDTTDNDFVFFNAFRGTSANAESVFVTVETIEDSLKGYFTQGSVQGEIGDSLAEYLERVQFKDSLDAATYLDSTNLTNQGVIPEDIDTTDNDFVFSSAYRGMSSQAESVFVTIETIEDSLALCGRVAGQVWTGAHDFGGATSLEIPNGANPTTDAEGEIAWDANDDAFEAYMGDESESALLPMYQDRSATITSPDGVNDTIILLHCDALIYPHGIEIDQISITTRGDGAYTLTLAEYSSAWAWQATTDSIVQASGFYTEDGTPMDNTLDADDYLTAYIPATDIDQLHIKVIYHVKEGN